MVVSSIQEHRPSRSRAGTPVCQRANPAVAVVRFHGGALEASYLQRLVVCAVGQSCAVCVLAMWPQVGFSQARTTSKPHISSKQNHKISRRWEFPLTRENIPTARGRLKLQPHINSALNDQHRDISELRHVKVVVKVDSIHGRNQWVACIRPNEDLPFNILIELSSCFGAYLPQSRGLLVIMVRFHTGLGLFCLPCVRLDYPSFPV